MLVYGSFTSVDSFLKLGLFVSGPIFDHLRSRLRNFLSEHYMENSEMWSLCMVVQFFYAKWWFFSEMGSFLKTFLIQLLVSWHFRGWFFWWGGSNYFMWLHSFFMYSPIISWFLVRVSDAYARKQIFFVGLGYAEGWLGDKKSYEIFFSHIWNPLFSVYNTDLLCNPF